MFLSIINKLKDRKNKLKELATYNTHGENQEEDFQIILKEKDNFYKMDK